MCFCYSSSEANYYVTLICSDRKKADALCPLFTYSGCNVTFLFPSLQAMESQIGDFYKDMGELGDLQGLSLPQRGLVAGDKEHGEQSGEVETRIVRLIEPLKERRRILLASKEMHQVAQDLEDEIVSFLLLDENPSLSCW